MKAVRLQQNARSPLRLGRVMEHAKVENHKRKEKMVVCARLELATSPMSRERATNCANRPIAKPR